MAGTPTTNYNIPTYADTDAPDLSGAYNDAMGIIDTQLKVNADAIESVSTRNYTGTNPIVVDNEKRTISVSKARSAQISDGAVTNYGDKGTLSFAGSADIIKTVASMPGNDKDTVVPNCYALTQYVAAHGGTRYTAGSGISISGTTIAAKPATTSEPGVVTVLNKEDPTPDVDSKKYAEGSVFTPSVYVLRKYVEDKMAAAVVAYTGTAPIAVDNGRHAISVNAAGDYTWNESGITSIGSRGVVSRVNLPNTDVARRIDTQGADYWTTGEPSYTVPTVATLKSYVALHTPNASTSAKGLVQLTTAYDTSNRTLAVTGASIGNALNGLLGSSNRARDAATTPLTTGMLANLYVTPSGMVVYKAPSE